MLTALGIAAALVLLSALLYAARAAFRRAVREELVAYLAEAHPEVRVTGRPGDALTLAVAGGEGTMYLDKVYAGVAALRPDSPEGRRRVFSEFADALLSVPPAEKLDLAEHGDRLLPRLVDGAFLAELPPDAADLPRTPLGDTGLLVVYVLDHDEAVAYLTRPQLEDLGLDVAALHDRALENLGRRFPAEAARRAIEEATGGRGLSVLKSGDSYDAARLLLLPRHLREGEVVAAAVPDRDTLAVAPVPEGDWTPLRKLAGLASGPVLLDRPLRVTREGVSRV